MPKRSYFLTVLTVFALVSLGHARVFETKKAEITVGGDYWHGHQITVDQHEVVIANDPSCPVHIWHSQVYYISTEATEVIRDAIDKRVAELESERYLDYESIQWLREKRKKYEEDYLIIKISADGKAIAVKFAIFLFDAFKENLDGLIGILYERPTFNMEWLYDAADTHRFKRHGVALIFVQEAQLENGTKWTYDPELLALFLRDAIGVDYGEKKPNY